MASIRHIRLHSKAVELPKTEALRQEKLKLENEVLLLRSKKPTKIPQDFFLVKERIKMHEVEEYGAAKSITETKEDPDAKAYEIAALKYARENELLRSNLVQDTKQMIERQNLSEVMHVQIAEQRTLIEGSNESNESAVKDKLAAGEMTDVEKEAWCVLKHTESNVIPHISWGSLSREDRIIWSQIKCDRYVGGIAPIVVEDDGVRRSGIFRNPGIATKIEIIISIEQPLVPHLFERRSTKISFVPR